MRSAILKKIKLGDDSFEYTLSAPLISANCRPGQFVIVMPYENSERIPLTIADFSRAEKTITVVFLILGKTTLEMSHLKEGDELFALLGPLGAPTHISQNQTAVLVGGGIGIAPLYPIARALKEKGNKVITVLGARSKDKIICYDKLKEISDKIYASTDDGSFGEKGNILVPLEKVIKEEKPDFVFCAGPLIMMKFVSGLTARYSVKTIVSMNPIMVDGTGMCGSCRLTVGGEVKFACVDGPDFDASKIDFDEVIKRNSRYADKEKEDFNHICNLYKVKL